MAYIFKTLDAKPQSNFCTNVPSRLVREKTLNFFLLTGGLLDVPKVLFYKGRFL
jgi:hypothetical protein